MQEMANLCAEIRACQKCDLGRGRTNAVPGEGPVPARIMFIGEGPGYHEDQQGRPFVGAAGQYLSELLGRIGLRREDVYITNVVKCRPPRNRDPLPEEIEACQPYLDRQIALVQPAIIVTLGRYSMARYFPGQSISRIHGVPKYVNGIWCFPMFHPAAGLHQPRYRTMIEEDFQKLAKLLKDLERAPKAEEESSPPTPPPAQQLSLF